MNETYNAKEEEALETIEVDDLEDLFMHSHRSIYYPVNVVVKSGTDDLMYGVCDIDFHHIKSLKIENPDVFFCSDDGKYLFAEDPDNGNVWIIKYLGNEIEIVIPDGTYGISRRAFEGKENLESVRFPEGLTQIRENAFWDTGLREVAFPESVKTISEGAFENCPNLTTVHFKGSGSEHNSPASEDEGLKPGALFDVTDVYLDYVPEGIIASLTAPVTGNGKRRTSKSYTFTIHYNDSNIVFPREIDSDCIDSAEEMIRKIESGINAAGFSFTVFTDSEVMTALEAFKKYGIEDAKQCLIEYGAYLFSLIGCVDQEEPLRETLDLYEENHMLDSDMLIEAKKVCEEHDWPVTRAYVMDLARKVRQKNSFII